MANAIKTGEDTVAVSLTREEAEHLMVLISRGAAFGHKLPPVYLAIEDATGWRPTGRVLDPNGKEIPVYRVKVAA